MAAETSVRPRCLRDAQARKAWTIIMRVAGAEYGLREDFIRYVTTPSPHPYEFRFMGSLGFGGKFHWTPTQGAWVSCYPEDADDIAKAIVEVCNRLLKAGI